MAAMLLALVAVAVGTEPAVLEVGNPAPVLLVLVLVVALEPWLAQAAVRSHQPPR